MTRSGRPGLGPKAEAGAALFCVCWATPPSRAPLASGPMQTLLRTPLYDRHVALGARLVPFAGWEMPVQYEGVIPEHLAVRNDSGVFDVSHMGELEVEGAGARAFLQAVLSNDLERIGPGQ